MYTGMKQTPQLPEYGWHTPKAASPSFQASLEPVPAITEPALPPVPDEPLPLHPISCPAGPFSVRTKRILFNDRISTLYDLLRLTEEELLDLKNFGKKCLLEVESYLARRDWNSANTTYSRCSRVATRHKAQDGLSRLPSRL